jgi:putative ABC transport system ATP-binding protein
LVCDVKLSNEDIADGCGAAFETRGLVSRGSISYPDVTIPRNKVTFIIGESGTGKTTLLRLFNQTETQTSGTVSFFGSDLGDRTMELRKNAILCGQNVFLFNNTVRENFNEFRRYADLPPMSDNDILRFLEICCSGADLNKKVKNMSGGERARIFLAIHLSFRPLVLMLDEPTSALDRDTANAVMGNVRSYCIENEMTLIVVSHDRSIIDSFADEVIDLGGKKNGH